MNTLFGYLSSKFSAQPENLATEALCYILTNSLNARNAVQKFIALIDPHINKKLLFQTQVCDKDNAIPDLVAFGEDNTPICIIEAKFWAGLTQHQPVTYLRRLPPNKPSLLLFLAPLTRMEPLWNELVERVVDKKFELQEIQTKSDMILGSISNHNKLAVTNWTSFLNVILTELDIAGDVTHKSDLLQLQGLCALMDSDAFLPLQPQEISPSVAKRNMQFGELINEIVTKGVSEKVCSTKSGKLRTTAGPYHYGRYFMLGSFCCAIFFANDYWAHIHNTPIWLAVFGRSWDKGEDNKMIQRALMELEICNPRRFFLDDSGTPIVAIKLEVGVEKHKVVDSIMRQLREVLEMLRRNYKK